MDDPKSSEESPIERFDPVERSFHWFNALLFVVLAVTGAIIFFPSLAVAVGNRDVVRTVHDIAGFATVGLVVFMLGSWGRGLRRDVMAMDTFDAKDRRWLRSGWREDLFGDPRSAPSQGKFNAGQKLNAAFSAAATMLLIGTGTIMFWHRQFPLWLKQGANLVHDLTAFLLVVVVLGHVGFAIRDRESMRGMLSGRVGRRWARAHHADWADELEEG